MDALVDALRSGKVASAGIDVFETEPCTESPLHQIDNVVLTPHLGASTSEAQDRAGDQIAELVAAGLRGDMVDTAVNIAPVAPEVMEAVGPFPPVAEALGTGIGQIARGPVSEIEVHFIGHLAEQDTRILKTAMLKGLLSVVGQDMVNYVNANHYAEQRGISVTENKRVESTDYVSLMVVVAKTGDREYKLGATLIGKKNEPRLVVFNEFSVDMAPSAHMLFLEYTDVPGVVGKVGTALGESGINIASMQVGQHRRRWYGAHGHQRGQRDPGGADGAHQRQGRGVRSVERGAVGLALRRRPCAGMMKRPCGAFGRSDARVSINGDAAREFRELLLPSASENRETGSARALPVSRLKCADRDQYTRTGLIVTPLALSANALLISSNLYFVMSLSKGKRPFSWSEIRRGMKVHITASPSRTTLSLIPVSRSAPTSTAASLPIAAAPTIAPCPSGRNEFNIWTKATLFPVVSIAKCAPPLVISLTRAAGSSFLLLIV